MRMRNILISIAIGGSVGFLAARIPLGPVGAVLDAQAEILGPEVAKALPVLAVLVAVVVVVWVLVQVVSGLLGLIGRLIRRYRDRDTRVEVRGDR